MTKILIRKSGTMGMGTGTDVRIYNPRSESSTMFRANNEDESTGTGQEDSKYRDERTELKRKKREERASEMKKLPHIPINLETLPQEDEDLEPTKFDNELEPSLMTGTHGNMGALTSLATQARGPGFAGGHAFAMGEPMDIAFQFLKAYEDGHLQSYLDGDIDELGMFGHSFDQNRFPFLHVNANHPFIHDNDDAVNELMGSVEGVEAFAPRLRDLENELKALHDHTVLSNSPQGSPPHIANAIDGLVRNYREESGWHNMTHEDVMKIAMTMYMATLKAMRLKNEQSAFDPSMRDLKGEPMDIAFQLLKRDERQGFIGKKPKREKGKKATKDHKERSKKWRPSTGEFKRPPGGMTPGSATSRRAKARMRGIKGGKKTGLSRAHLAVEMSHRGVKTKQPMSKDPRRYRQYLGQSEARKRLGNVRTVAATPARYGARSYRAGKTGGGTLQSLLPGQAAGMRAPPLRRVRTPPLVPPQVPRAPAMPRAPPIPGAPPLPQARSGYSNQSMAGGPQYVPSRMPSATVQGGPSMVMTSKVGVGSDLQKRGLSYYDIAELRQLVNDARRAMKRKESKKKGKGTSDTSGAGSNLPRHNNAPTKETTRPEGATEDANNEPRTFGINPLDHLTSRGGRTP